jgi:hypothetical protein
MVGRARPRFSAARAESYTLPRAALWDDALAAGACRELSLRLGVAISSRADGGHRSRGRSRPADAPRVAAPVVPAARSRSSSTSRSFPHQRIVRGDRPTRLATSPI